MIAQKDGVKRIRTDADLKPGVIVKVKEGSFKDRVGRISEIKGDEVWLETRAFNNRLVYVRINKMFLVPQKKKKNYHIERVSKSLARLVEAGAYTPNFGEKPFEYDLQIRRNWIWFNGYADRDRLELDHGISSEYVANLWTAKLPVLIISYKTLETVNSRKSNILPPKQWLKSKSVNFRQYIKRHYVGNYDKIYRGKKFKVRDFIESAEKPLYNKLFRKFESKELIPASVIFIDVPFLGYKFKRGSPFGRPNYLFVPLVPRSAVKNGLIQVLKFGMFFDKFESLSLL